MRAIVRLLTTVSLPRLREHPARTALTAAGVMLGVSVLVAVLLVNRSIMGSITSTFDDIGGKADWQVSAGPLGLDEGLLDRVKATPGVFKATPVLQQSVRIAASALAPERAEALRGQYLLLLGVEFLDKDDEYFRAYGSQEIESIKEDPIAFLNSSTNIILSGKFAREHGFKERDTIPLMTPEGRRDFTIWGFVEEGKLGRAFGGSIGVMYYQAAQVAYGRGSNVDRFDVAVAPGASTEEVRSRLLAALGPGFEVERPDRRTGRVEKMLQGFNYALTGGSLFALLVGTFLIFNAISISVVQRKREIGILRALGTTRRQILGMFVLEALVMGGLGSVAGVALGLGLARVLLTAMTRTVNELYLQIAADDVHLDPLLVGAAFVLGVGATLVSAWWPAKVATEVQPVETLRAGAIAGPREARASRRADVIALVLGLLGALCYLMRGEFGGAYLGYVALFATSMTFALLMPRVLLLVRAALRPLAARVFGIEGHLANENLLRDVGRTSVTAAALMIAVSMVISFAVFFESFVGSVFRWIDQSVPADIFVTSSARFSGVANVPMTNELYPYFQELPGVESVDRVRIADADYADLRIKLLSLEWDIYSRHAKLILLEGELDAIAAGMRAGDGMVLSENFARRFDLHVGGSVTLSTPNGPRAWRVVGVAVDYTSDQGLVFIPRASYVAGWNDDKVDTYELYLGPGADSEALRTRIRKDHGERYDLFVMSNAEFKGELKSLLAQAVQSLDALQLVALVIAVMGVLTTMLATVLDRVREIGVLRAIGALRRQIRKMVIVEAGLIGLASLAGGMVAGVLSGFILLYAVNSVQTGWHIPFGWPLVPMLLEFLLVVAVSVAAGGYPAWRAAGIPIEQALEYE